MARKKKEPPIKKDRTDLTGRHDITPEEIIKGLTPKRTPSKVVSPTKDDPPRRKRKLDK